MYVSFACMFLSICCTNYKVLAHAYLVKQCYKHEQDEDAFFKDYAESHKKLSELGFTPPRIPSRCNSGAKSTMWMVQTAARVAVAAAVLVLGYIIEVNRKKS